MEPRVRRRRVGSSALVGVRARAGRGAWSTSPFAPRTHWDQIYLPLLEPPPLQRGDELAIDIACETGGGESGIDVRWTVEQRRGGASVRRQSLDIREGFVG